MWAGRCVWHSACGCVWLLLADPWPFHVLIVSPGSEGWRHAGWAGRSWWEGGELCFSRAGLHVTRALMKQQAVFIFFNSLKMHAHDRVVIDAPTSKLNYRFCVCVCVCVPQQKIMSSSLLFFHFGIFSHTEASRRWWQSRMRALSSGKGGEKNPHVNQHSEISLVLMPDLIVGGKGECKLNAWQKMSASVTRLHDVLVEKLGGDVKGGVFFLSFF